MLTVLLQVEFYPPSLKNEGLHLCDTTPMLDTGTASFH